MIPKYRTARVCTLSALTHDSTVNHTAAADTSDRCSAAGEAPRRFSSRVSSSRCMQVLTTAPTSERAHPACKCSPRRHIYVLMRAQHASAHHGAPIRTCAPCMQMLTTAPRPQNLRALPRASSSTRCGQRRRSVASSRSNVPRAPDEMQSDAIRCHHRRQSDPIRSHQIPSDPIRSHQIPSDPIRAHQSQSEAIQSAGSAPLMLSERTEP